MKKGLVHLLIDWVREQEKGRKNKGHILAQKVSGTKH